MNTSCVNLPILPDEIIQKILRLACRLIYRDGEYIEIRKLEDKHLNAHLTAVSLKEVLLIKKENLLPGVTNLYGIVTINIPFCRRLTFKRQDPYGRFHRVSHGLIFRYDPSFYTYDHDRDEDIPSPLYLITYYTECSTFDSLEYSIQTEIE